MPEPTGGDIPKFNLSDLIDVETFQSQLTQIFAQTFEKIRETEKMAFKATFDEIANYLGQMSGSFTKTFELTFNKISQMGEGSFQKLADQKDELIEKVKQQGAQEIAEIRKTATSEQEMIEKLAAKQKEIDDKIYHLKKDRQKELHEQQKKAVETEQRLMAGTQKLMKGVANEAGRYSKSIMETKTWWEAALLAITIATARLTSAAGAAAKIRGAGLMGVTPTAVAGAATIPRIPGITPPTGLAEKVFREPIGMKAITPFEADEFLGRLAEAPVVFREIITEVDGVAKISEDGVKSLERFLGVMSNFRPDMAANINTMVEVSNAFGMSIDDMTTSLLTAKDVSDTTGMHVLDAFQSLLNMSQSMRWLTKDADAAKITLMAFARPLTELDFKPEEIQMFTKEFAGLLGTMAPSKLAGLRVLAGKGFPKLEEDLINAAKAPLSLIRDAFKPILDRFEKGSAMRVFVTEQLAKSIGFMRAANTEGARGFLKVLDLAEENVKAAQEELKEFQTGEAYATLEELEKQGWKMLGDKVGPLKQIENMFAEILVGWTKWLIPAMEKLNTWLARKEQTRETWELMTSPSRWGETRTEILKHEAQYRAGTEDLKRTKLMKPEAIRKYKELGYPVG